MYCLRSLLEMHITIIFHLMSINKFINTTVSHFYINSPFIYFRHLIGQDIFIFLYFGMYYTKYILASLVI